MRCPSQAVFCSAVRNKDGETRGHAASSSPAFSLPCPRQLPLSLLKTAVGHPMVRSSAAPLVSCLPCAERATPQLVELKNGETYNGNLVSCDTWMNLHLREVICTSKVRQLPSPPSLSLLTAAARPGAGRRPLLARGYVLHPRKHDQVPARPGRGALLAFFPKSTGLLTPAASLRRCWTRCRR